MSRGPTAIARLLTGSCFFILYIFCSERPTAGCTIPARYVCIHSRKTFLFTVWTKCGAACDDIVQSSERQDCWTVYSQKLARMFESCWTSSCSMWPKPIEWASITSKGLHKPHGLWQTCKAKCRPYSCVVVGERDIFLFNSLFYRIRTSLLFGTDEENIPHSAYWVFINWSWCLDFLKTTSLYLYFADDCK